VKEATMALAGPVLEGVTWPGGLTVALSALDAALDAIGGPVFIVDRRGEILHASQAGHRHLERHSAETRRTLAEMAASGNAPRPWELRPLQGPTPVACYLAVLRGDLPDKPSGDVLVTATRRWNLTARQREVLGLVVLGLTNTDIGNTLGIGECTVEFHLSAIFDKAGADNRATVIARMLDF
jgi:DNA-binding NarL/FixJ family response regulator